MLDTKNIMYSVTRTYDTEVTLTDKEREELLDTLHDYDYLDVMKEISLNIENLTITFKSDILDIDRLKKYVKATYNECQEYRVPVNPNTYSNLRMPLLFMLK